MIMIMTPSGSDADIAETSQILRAERDALLKESDWTQVADVPDTIKNKWKDYRQALRDITKQEGFPLDVIFPRPPYDQH